MTPQERQLIEQLFDRLAQLEREPRDAEAERAIRDGLTRAPNAVYALVQTALVQDEALRRASARIEELQAELDGDQRPAAPAEGGGSFLDRMRNTMFGTDDRRSGGSVPSVRAGDMDRRDERWGAGPGTSVPPGYRQEPAGGPTGGPFGGGYGGPGTAPSGGAFGGGGSFLGTAAAAAAGTIGGSLLLNSIRGMMGSAHASPAAGQGALDSSALGANRPSPWGGGNNAADSDLARQAGADDVGSGGGGGQQVNAVDDGSRSASQDHDAGNDQDDSDYDDSDSDFGDDSDFDMV
jgi:hypothetical protein